MKDKMNKEAYFEKRNALIFAAQNLLNEGKFEDVEAKKKEIEELDNLYTKISEEQANLMSLENNVPALDLNNSNVSIPAATVVGGTIINNEVNYEEVFAKVALNRELTNEEINVFNKYNPENVYTHSTKNTEIVIPETTIGGIEGMAAELHPILNDVVATRIKGTLRFVKHTEITSGDAKYYDENDATEDEENKFAELSLGGKELSKSITVSWKLQAMAINEFLPFLKRELGERMGAAKAYGVVKGLGDDKNPQGIITALDKEAGKPQIVEVSEINYESFTKAFSKIASQFNGGLKIYANNSTIWNTIANIKDKNDRPIFLDNVITPMSVGKVLGRDVVVEDALAEDEIIIGNVRNGYVMNIQETMKLTTEEHAKPRVTDFVAYEVNDGGVRNEKAFAVIRKATAIGG